MSTARRPKATAHLDGRPPASAGVGAAHRARLLHGRFVGNALVVQTTHIKQGWVRRNGLPGSDQTTMTDFFMRYGDHITNVTVANDPVFLSEPQVRSNDYARQPVDHGAWLYACDDGEQILDRAPDYVPHYLFGKQPFAREFAKKYNLPVAASLMGAASMYPELPAQLRAVTNPDALFSPAPGRPSETSRAVNPEPRDGEIHVLPVRNNVYMLVGDGGNIVVQTGDQGVFVVDTGEGKLSAKVHRGDSHAECEADPVHREHELSRRAYRRQCGAWRGRTGPEPAWLVLRATRRREV